MLENVFQAAAKWLISILELDQFGRITFGKSNLQTWVNKNPQSAGGTSVKL